MAIDVRTSLLFAKSIPLTGQTFVYGHFGYGSEALVQNSCRMELISVDSELFHIFFELRSLRVVRIGFQRKY